MVFNIGDNVSYNGKTGTIYRLSSLGLKNSLTIKTTSGNGYFSVYGNEVSKVSIVN